MLQPPLHATDYDSGFGTLYTAVYHPAEGSVEYRWPGSAWHLSFEAFPEQEHVVSLGLESDKDALKPARLSRRQILEEPRPLPSAGSQAASGAAHRR